MTALWVSAPTSSMQPAISALRKDALEAIWLSGLHESQKAAMSEILGVNSRGSMRDKGPRATQADAGQVGSLNFKVDPEFKKIFKGFEVSQGMTMVDLLKEGFALSQQKRGK